MTDYTVLDKIAFSGHNHIDALLDHGPDWNYQTGAGNVITYTFSVASGNEEGQFGQQEFSISQKFNTRAAMDYVSALTGIVFTEVADGSSASVHFCNLDIPDTSTSGLCSWASDTRYYPDTKELVSYSASAYIYLDNVQFGAQNGNLTPGGAGYETLLHEIGHMLGLKHPFETDADNPNTLPYAEDNTFYTLLSYTDAGGPYSTFSSYDVAALNWIYGGDGLGGALGVGSVTGARYLTGTAGSDFLTGTGFNDTLRGNGGDDIIDGGAGTDTAVYAGASTSYSILSMADGTLRIQGDDGIDLLRSVELIQFSNGSFSREQVAQADTTAPVAPTLSVPKNTAGYIDGNAPFLSGIAEALSTVKVFSGATQLGTTTANAQGFWTLQSIVLGNGNYSVSATSTDASGNVSSSSAPFSFKIDATAPTAPSAAMVLATGGNQPLFSGTGEAGTTIYLVDATQAVLGKTMVDAGGGWSIASAPMANAAYNVTVRSVDAADNSTAAPNALAFTVNSALNLSGTAGDDKLTGTAGNNALSGLGGTDTAVYAGARTNYTVSQFTNGHTVNAASGTDGFDSLIGVERIQFADTHVALDISGVGGQAYRLYQAAYDRAPDLAGIGFWISRMDDGAALKAVATDFLNQPEFTALYGANASNTTFVSKLYEHVLHRPLDQPGADFWVNGLNSGLTTRGEVLLGFSESAENIAQVVGSIENGFEYTLYTG